MVVGDAAAVVAGAEIKTKKRFSGVRHGASGVFACPDEVDGLHGASICQRYHIITSRIRSRKKSV
jgi:hypothetical protein